MTLSENSFKWLMRFYPPFLFQRIWIRKIHADFRGIEVKINRSVFTTNMGKSTFGGTIFSATDPFYALLFDQIMKREGIRPVVWLKSARISYLKPGRSDLFFTIRITPEMIEEALEKLRTEGKFVKEFPIRIYDREGQLCVEAMNEVYIRDKDFNKLAP